MIAELSIENLVLADRIELLFKPGLVVLTGETGAGKSLIGQALYLATGGRAKSGLVRRGQDHARVDLVLQFDGAEQQIIDQELKLLGLPQSESGRIIVRREIKASGGTRSWVGGVPVSLRSLSSLWKQRLARIDQGAAAVLESSSGRLALLDRSLNDAALLQKMADAAKKWQDAQAHQKELQDQLEHQKDQREMIRHWVDELAQFDPQPDEFDELIEQRRIVRNQRQQKASLQRAETIIGSDRGILSGLNELRSIAARSEKSEQFYEFIAQADQAVDSFLRVLQNQTSDLLKIDEEALQDRLFRWRDLARKHRCNDTDLATHYQTLVADLEQLDNPETALKLAEIATQKTRAQAEKVAHQLTRARQKSAQEITKKLSKILPDLGFKGAEIQLDINRKSQLNSTGWDQFDILLQANPGEGFSPVQEGASGGEKARILLALDCSLPRTDYLTTIFYDEVDAGMGGKTAAAVARLLAQQSQHLQVLVVTHQAAVAAAAKQHIQVTKSTQNGRTQLQTCDLQGIDREDELVRMTSGDVAIEAAQVVARALIDESTNHATV
jgi:DNA repair protein RecN (Recombination protein N)